MDSEQELLQELASIQAKLERLQQRKKEEATAELEQIAEEINRLVSEAKKKAAAAGLHFEYSQGYDSFGVYQWEQSDYC